MALDPLPPTSAFVALGGNLGDAVATVREAFDALAAMPRTVLVRCSSLYRSAPVESSGPDYVNAVAWIDTTLGPLELLHALQQIEQSAGRTRPWHNAPRTLDLDLLLYGQQVIDLPTLTVPHPRMFERAFVLMPLAEIAPTQVPSGRLETLEHQRIARIEN